MAKTPLRAVPDTNILLASEMSSSSSSANQAFFERWESGDFTVLFSQDTLYEYVKKLRQKMLPEASIRKFLAALLNVGVEVEIEYYHLPAYPVDADDIAFLLCADNGRATHLVTYDKHLLEVEAHYPFRVCGAPAFLEDLRHELRAS
jgi:predicted nucleic acid-binding protein